MTLRMILLSIFMACYITQNAYFGWHLKPESFAEQWWDSFCMHLLIFGMFAPDLMSIIHVAFKPRNKL